MGGGKGGSGDEGGRAGLGGGRGSSHVRMRKEVVPIVAMWCVIASQSHSETPPMQNKSKTSS